MEKPTVIARGIGHINKVERGESIDWNDNLFVTPTLIKDKIIYIKGNAPLYRIAFLIENKAKAVLFEKGGRNYHPLILLNEALLPAIAGIGIVDFAGKKITIDSGSGIIYDGEKDSREEPNSPTDEKIKIPKIKGQVYVNVGYPTALEAAAKSGADGIGLLRTEFIAARTLSKILNEIIYDGITIKEALEKSNEADVIYNITKHSLLKNILKNELKETIMKALFCFGEKEIIIRTFDIARDEDDSLGNRGIRRCISEGCNSLRIFSEAIKEVVMEKRGKCNIGVIFPLVSHYSQIKTALDIFLDAGLSLRQEGNNDVTGIKFGWQMELPAASLNNEIWLDVFTREYGISPHIICIGTNDLTQYTIALDRNADSKEKNQEIRKYLGNLYDESDFSVIRQVCEVSRQCKKFKTRLILTGEASSKPQYLQLILSFGIIPSVAHDNVIKVKNAVCEFEKKGDSRQVIEEYVNNVCKHYPSKVRTFLKPKLLKIIYNL